MDRYHAAVLGLGASRGKPKAAFKMPNKDLFPTWASGRYEPLDMKQWFLGVHGARVCRGHYLNEKDWPTVVALLLPASIYQDWVWRYIYLKVPRCILMGVPWDRAIPLNTVEKGGPCLIGPTSQTPRAPLGFRPSVLSTKRIPLN
jgi:hypothetical protein